jgi:hypothetical protein
VPAVDATTAAAWITGGVGALGIIGTVVTAIVGSRSTKRATEATIAAGAATTTATLAAAREDRLWEKRCAVYEETLATLLNHREHRGRLVKLQRLADERQPVKAIYDSDSREWSRARSRLYAYASDAVLTASEVAEDAHMRVQWAYEDMDQLRQQASGHPPPASEGEGLHDVSQKLNAAWEAVSTTELALIRVIRDELRSRPEAAALPAPLPAQRRGIWHRR